MNSVLIEPLKTRNVCVTVPASKSILSRALLLSAFTEGETRLTGCSSFGQDTQDLLSCLEALGIRTHAEGDEVTVFGTRDFRRSATLNVGSAGTAARFLTAILAFAGGEYELQASPQMSRRPMDVLDALTAAGADVRFLGEEGHFPFRLRSQGIRAERLTVDTDVSTQYASGILLAAALGERPFTLQLTGSRTDGSYIQTTLNVLQAFGATCTRSEEEITVSPIRTPTGRFPVPPDVSGACYFYALSLLCGARVLVRNVGRACAQPDLRFLDLLAEKGVSLRESGDGIIAEGSASFTGFDADMRNFSDQTLTLAALAPFAQTSTLLKNIGHIRRQECDRVAAIERNLTALGVPVEVRGDRIRILPAPPRSLREPVRIETFRDHRVAMAFSLVGLKTGNVVIEDPDCCKKTFGNFFELLKTLT